MSLRTDFETNSLEPLPVHALCLPLKMWALSSLLLQPCLPLAPVLPCHEERIPLLSNVRANSSFHKLPWSWLFITATEMQAGHSPKLLLSGYLITVTERELIHTAFYSHFPEDLPLNTTHLGDQAWNTRTFGEYFMYEQ